MIKFFRRFRQKMLTENRFSKYLLYAVGEIILVVIGILIALQIDNLNDKRKSLNKYQNYLKDLQAEIIDNQSILEFNKENTYRQMLYSFIALDSLNNNEVPLDSRSDYLYKLIQQMGPLRTQVYKTTVMDELINSGGYETISSENIKRGITAYNSNLNKFYDLVNDLQDAFRSVEYPYLQEHFSLLDMWNKYDMSIDATELGLADRVIYRNREKYFDIDFDAFYNNKQFANILNFKHFELRHIYRTLLSQEKTFRDLLEQIEMEKN